MRGLLALLWRHRARVGLGLLALLVVDGLQMLSPLLVRRAVDGLVAGADGAWLPALGVAAVGLAVAAVRYWWRILVMGAARLVRFRLRSRLHRRLVALPPRWHAAHPAGDHLTRASTDVDAVANACGLGLVAAFDASVMTALTIGAMLWLDVRLTLLALIPLLPLGAAVWWIGGLVHRRHEAVQERAGRIAEQVREAVAGIRTVRGYAQEAGIETRLGAEGAAFIADNRRLAAVAALFDPVIALCAGATLVLVLWLGGQAVIAGTFSLGAFVAFAAYLGMLAWPMMATGWVVNLVSRGSASLARIEAVLRQQGDLAEADRPRPLPAEVSLRAQGLGATHPGAARPALAGLDLDLPAGGVLGVVGTTGSGKSTLAHLLVRRFDPSAGTLQAGGVPLAEVRLDDLRRAAALVPQEPFVFALSVHDNVAWGRPRAGADEVAAALRCAGLEREVAALPRGAATLLGERGVTLSGGQRQRLGIARALLAEPRLLVLDDCLSAVDAITERAVLGGLRAWRAARPGCTLVVIAHRISAVREAGHIIVLDRGAVVERGTHAGLAAAGGLYQRLWDLQREAEAPP